MTKETNIDGCLLVLNILCHKPKAKANAKAKAKAKARARLKARANARANAIYSKASHMHLKVAFLNFKN